MNFNEVPYRYPARFVVVDGFRLAYVDVNPEAAGPIVFLHDVGGDLDDFSGLYETLAYDHRVVGLDWVGFGKSDKPPLDEPVPLFTELLDGFLASLDLDRVSLVGHGLGAMVAARFAADHPERVDRLVLSALPGVRELTEDERAAAADFWSYDRISALDDEGRRAWYQSMAAGWNEKLEAFLRVRNELAQCLAFRPWAHAVEDAALSMLDNPLGDRLGRIQAPTLLVWGVDDPVVPLAMAAEASAAIPRARLTSIEDCGHLPAFEQLESYLDAIATFFEEPSRTGDLTGTIHRRVEDLEPWPGLTIGIGRLAQMLFEQRDALAEATAGSLLEDVASKPTAGLPSVGTLMLHAASRSVWYLYEVLRGEPVPADVAARVGLDAADPDRLIEAPRRSAGRLLGEVEWAHELLAEWLKRCSDADLNRTYTPRDGSSQVTLRWALWRLLDETIELKGRVVVTRAFLGERAVYQAPRDSIS